MAYAKLRNEMQLVHHKEKIVNREVKFSVFSLIM
ncbi:hypothetical protein Xind_00279 [Xenorhabdus indica]|nr:hypothetical protein [Xenorhabdus indica]